MQNEQLLNIENSFAEALNGPAKNNESNVCHQRNVQVGRLLIVSWGRPSVQILITARELVVHGALTLPAIVALDSEREDNDAELVKNILIRNIKVVLDTIQRAP